MKLKKILGNLFGAPKDKPVGPTGATGGTGPTGSIPGIAGQFGYVAMRQKAIDIRAGKRGVRTAKAKQAVKARLKQLHEWMREGNEVRRFTRERQLEERAGLSAE